MCPPHTALSLNWHAEHHGFSLVPNDPCSASACFLVSVRMASAHQTEQVAFAFSGQRVPLQSNNEVWSVTTFNKEAGSVDLRHFQLSLTGDVWLSLRLMFRQTCETRGSWGEWFELHARQIQFQVSPLHGWVAYKTLWVCSFWRRLNAKLCSRV